MTKEVLELVGGKVRVKEKKRSKYRNVRTEVDGVKFDSKSEAKRWKELVLLEKAGEIEYLARQREFPINIHSIHICTYKSDFCYLLTGKRRGDKANKFVIEDVKGGKGTQTAVFNMKKRLMAALYNIDILITGKGT